MNINEALEVIIKECNLYDIQIQSDTFAYGVYGYNEEFGWNNDCTITFSIDYSIVVVGYMSPFHGGFSYADIYEWDNETNKYTKVIAG